MTKYRIIEEVNSLGETNYYVQCKLSGFWGILLGWRYLSDPWTVDDVFAAFSSKELAEEAIRNSQAQDRMRKDERRKKKAKKKIVEKRVVFES